MLRQSANITSSVNCLKQVRADLKYCGLGGVILSIGRLIIRQ